MNTLNLGRIFRFCSVCGVLLLMFACTDNHTTSVAPPVTYTLTTNVNPAGGGTISRNPNKSNYSDGEQVTVTAVPTNGFTFVGWVGASTSSAVSITVFMNGNKTLTAKFEQSVGLDSKLVLGSNEAWVECYYLECAVGFTFQSNGKFTLIEKNGNSWRVSDDGTWTTQNNNITLYFDDGSIMAGPYTISNNTLSIDFDLDDMPYIFTKNNNISISTVPLLAAPTNVTATAISSSSVTVSWSPVSGAIGYYVYYSLNPNGTFTNDGSVTGTTVTYIQLPASTTYYYRVAAYNGDGIGSQSNSVVVTTLASVPMLSAPTDVKVGLVFNDEIILTWKTDPDATQYNVYWSFYANGPYSYDGSAKGINMFTSNGLSENTTYYYKVTAVNSAGVESEPSAYVYAKTKCTGASAPTGVKFTRTGQVATSYVAGNLSWNTVPGASYYTVYCEYEGGTYKVEDTRGPSLPYPNSSTQSYMFEKGRYYVTATVGNCESGKSTTVYIN